MASLVRSMALVHYHCGRDAAILSSANLPLSQTTLLPLLRPCAIRVSFSRLPRAPTGSRPIVRIVVKATNDPDMNEILKETLKSLQEKWDATEDKIALGILGFSAFLSLWASIGVLSAIDKLPLFPSLFELVGIFYSVWFVYRYLLFKPDREEFLNKLEGFMSRIMGSNPEQ